MSFRTDRLRSKSFRLGIRELVDGNGRENGLDSAYNMSLDNLGGYVCDEGLLGDLIFHGLDGD